MAVFTATIALGKDPTISSHEIKRDFATNWPDLPISEPTENPEGIISFHIGESDVLLAQMPAPIPWSELEGPCATSFLWRDAEKELRPHATTLIVAAVGDAAPLALARLATLSTAAVLATCPAAIGVYWGSATLVIPAKIFRDFAVEVLPTEPPIQIWIDFRVGENANGKSFGFTHGLKHLGFMEVETENATEPPVALRNRLWSLATYLLEKGPVIKNGNTVGQDAKERIRVVYAPSAFGHRDEVMRLEYESV